MRRRELGLRAFGRQTHSLWICVRISACWWLLSCGDPLDPTSLGIPVIACVNSLSWNSFSKDDPPWGEA